MEKGQVAFRSDLSTGIKSMFSSCSLQTVLAKFCWRIVCQYKISKWGCFDVIPVVCYMMRRNGIKSAIDEAVHLRET